MEKVKSDKIEKMDGRKKNGGPRPNSGRRPLAPDEELLNIKQLLAEHATTIDEKEKRHQILILMDKLYEVGKTGNIQAIKEYLDRQIGKSKESIDITTKGEALYDQDALRRAAQEFIRTDIKTDDIEKDCPDALGFHT